MSQEGPGLGRDKPGSHGRAQERELWRLSSQPEGFLLHRVQCGPQPRTRGDPVNASGTLSLLSPRFVALRLAQAEPARPGCPLVCVRFDRAAGARTLLSRTVVWKWSPGGTPRGLCALSFVLLLGLPSWAAQAPIPAPGISCGNREAHGTWRVSPACLVTGGRSKRHCQKSRSLCSSRGGPASGGGPSLV